MIQWMIYFNGKKIIFPTNCVEANGWAGVSSKTVPVISYFILFYFTFEVFVWLSLNYLEMIYVTIRIWQTEGATCSGRIWFSGYEIVTFFKFPWSKFLNNFLSYPKISGSKGLNRNVLWEALWPHFPSLPPLLCCHTNFTIPQNLPWSW